MMPRYSLGERGYRRHCGILSGLDYLWLRTGA